MKPRLRILLSAFYCSPHKGGESAVGWQVATGLAKHHDITVICGDLKDEAPTLKDLERYHKENGLPEGLDVRHVQLKGLARFIHRFHQIPGLWFLYYVAYRRWQLQALETARELHSEKPFDLVHHLTIIGYREPGYLWQLGIPFFWGPINGAASIPWAYVKRFGGAGRYRHLVRNILNALQMRLPSRSRKAAKAATKIWAVTKEDQEMVQGIWGQQAELMLETGATPVAEPIIRILHEGEPLRLVWCGLIEARKALDLAIEAIARLPETSRVELHVVGDGPERDACQLLAERLAVSSAIRWHGRVSHAEAQILMAKGHALIHTAVKEGTPHVVLEALAQGMPVICHDSCGMGIAVTDYCGIKVSMVTPEESIAGIASAMKHMLNNPEELHRLSLGASRQAENLHWSCLIKRLQNAYHSHCG